MDNINGKNIKFVQSGEYRLATRCTGSGKITVLFESCVGGDMQTWIDTGIEESVNTFASVILYNRAGIKPSENTNTTLSIENAIKDLNEIIKTIPKSNKIILVGHSLGGAIIRGYTAKYPTRISGLILVDSTHEVMFKIYKPEEGKKFGDEFLEYLKEDGYSDHDAIFREAKEIENTLLYLKKLDLLPNIYITTITAVKGHSSDVMFEQWRNAHKSLGTDNSKYRHIDASKSGHFIQNSEPEIITNAISEMKLKLDGF